MAEVATSMAEAVKAPRMRHGENYEARVAHEYVLVLRRRP